MKSKEELIAELKVLKERLYRYKRITKGARAINAQMNLIYDELIANHGMTEEEIWEFEIFHTVPST